MSIMENLGIVYALLGAQLRYYWQVRDLQWV